MMDDFGRVFYLDDKVYRAIQNSKKRHCLELINSELFRELIDGQLIPRSSVAGFSIEGHDLVLEHEKLTETHQYEWSFNMLKEAALAVLKVNELCNKYGYELKDGHTLNVLFKGTKPMWVDIGSIAPRDKKSNETWIAYDEFVGSFLVPLLFWAEGKIYIARKLLESNFHRIDLLPAQSILESKLLNLLDRRIHHYKISNIVLRLLNIIVKSRRFHTNYFSYNKIKRALTGLKPPVMASMWQDYHHYYYTVDGKQTISPRFSRIIEIINGKADSIKSVLDLAGNQGLMCRLIKEKTNIKKITLTDYDANAIDFAFDQFKKEYPDSIDLLLLNFMFNIDLEGSSKRIKSDLVMALAVTHHLVLTAGYSLSSIFERVKLYSNRYVMIEFMPLGLWVKGSSVYPKLPEWYNEKWFKETFEKHFILLAREQLEENRILFFGEIIN